jgi:putative transposase
MGRSPAVALELSARQLALLQQLVRRQTADQRLVRRASLLLALAANNCLEVVAKQLSLTRLTVRHWRDRFLQAGPTLRQAEAEQATGPQLLALLVQVLDDAPRPGTPVTFTPEQIVQIVAVACEPPAQSGRPISHWTPRELADEVQKRQIVQAISVRTVGRFLKGGRSPAPPQPVLAQRQPQGS